MLELRNLCVDYDAKRVIHDVSFKLEPGEILCLVGPTGCGKSTLLRTIAGLEPPSDGELQIGELLVTARQVPPPEKRNTGLVFQDFALFPHLNVLQNVAFKLDNNELAEQWLDKIGLGDFKQAKPLNLSGGQKQRVALARALAHEPQLMLLDEPLSCIDASLKKTLRWEIRNTLKDAGIPAIWVTHDQDEALSIGDRVGILRDGRLEQLDAPEQCFTSPANRFVAEFLGEAEFLPGKLSGNTVTSVLGTHQVRHPVDAENVDILLRPNDLAITADDSGNVTIKGCRYEGETRLYRLHLDDGSKLDVRCHHEQMLADDCTVRCEISTTQALSVFAR